MDIVPRSGSGAPGRVQLAVMAKAPIPGVAKTRLIASLGPHGAARLQRELTRRTLATAIGAGLGLPTLWCAPDAGHPFFRAIGKALGMRCVGQPEEDLGERMHAAFRLHCPDGPLVLVGTDCPVLRASHLREAARALEDGDDAVFQPAEDGGYVLVGLRQPRPELFRGIEWSTVRVMSETRARASQLGLRVRELDTVWDVDRPSDVARLAALAGDARAARRFPVPR